MTVTWHDIKLALPPDVSRAQVEAWLLLVPRLEPESPRAPQYVKGWNVVEKIRRARLDGSLPEGFDELVRRRSMIFGQPPKGALTILFE